MVQQGTAAMLLGALLAIAATCAKAQVEMSSSAIVFYNSDFRKIYFDQPLCTLLMDRIAERSGSRRVQLVPTMYWYDRRNEQDPENTCRPDGWSETDQKVDFYCNKDEWNSPCVPFTPAVIQELTEGFTNCFKRAFTLFDELLLAPHLDDGLKRGHWRNLLHFDPLKKDPYGYSYYDILLKPMLDALNTPGVAPAGKTVWFGMEGEMGGTVFSYPQQYIKIAQTIRKEWNAPAKLLVGTTFNHAYLYGYINRGPAEFGPAPPSPMSKWDGGFGPVLPLEQWPNVDELKANLPAIKRLLFNATDFMGISNYARAPADVKPSDIESAIIKYENELAVMGISLQELIKKKKFIMNEFALGGGISECGDTIATTAEEAGLYPWLGITTPYTGAAKDPWKASSAAKAYLIKYYQAALHLLTHGGRYRVDSAYLWNIVSWDVQAIHTASALWGQDGFDNGFGNREVTAMIKTHNIRAVAARAAAIKAKADGKPVYLPNGRSKTGVKPKTKPIKKAGPAPK